MIGWYGKIPGTGDFIVRRIPPAFREPWDRWLQAAIEGSRQRLGAGWRDAYLSMPAWRFVLGPGFLDANAWAGLMLPSVDAIGRYFPLTVTCALPSMSLDAVATLIGAGRWFHEIESIALAAIAPGADAGSVDGALAKRRFDPLPMRGAKPQMLCLELGDGVHEPQSAWLAEPSELFGRTLLLCDALPSGEQFCAMMNGRWAEHGWRRRELGSQAHQG